MYRGQSKAFWFTGISRMWKNRINNAPLRSSNTHTAVLSCAAMARGTSTHTYAHHYVRESGENKSLLTKLGDVQVEASL